MAFYHLKPVNPDSVTSVVQGMDSVKVETNCFLVGFFRALLMVKELVSL